MIAALFAAALSAAPPARHRDLGVLAAARLRATLDAGRTCVEVTGIRVESVSVHGDAASASLEAMARNESVPSHWLVRLQRNSSGWRAVRLDVRERLLAERLAAAPDADARRALFAAEPELLTPELVRRLVEQGDRLNDAGQMPVAEDLSLLAREIAADWDDLDGQASALRLLGRTFNSKSDLKKSRHAYEEGHALAERAHDPALIAATLVGMATEGMRSGDFDHVQEDLKEGLRIAQSVHDDRTAGAALHRLAWFDYQEGRPDAALREYDQALSLARRAGDVYLEAVVDADLGITYDDMNRHLVAYDSMGRGIELFRRLGNTTAVIHNLRNLADMEAWDQLDADAEKHLREVEILLRSHPSERTSAYVHTTRCTLALRHRELAAADRDCSAGIALAEKAGVKVLVTTLTEQLAHVRIEQGRYGEAVALATAARDRARTLTPNFDVYWQSLTDLGQAQARLGKIAEARAALSAAIATIEGTQSEAPSGSEDQQTFFSDKVLPYYEMFGTFAGTPERAIPWVEQARARTLLDLLAARKHTSTRSITAAEQAEEAAIEHGIAALNIDLRTELTRPQPDDARIKALERDIDAKRVERTVFLRRLYEAHPDLAVARGDVPPASVAEIQRMIPADGAALEYVCTTDRSWVVVVTRGEAPRIYTIGMGGQSLHRLVARFNAELAARSPGFSVRARRLYDLLLAPAENALAKKRVICIIPDPNMANLPFQALIGADGRYLIEHGAVFYAPSLAFLAWRANHAAPQPAGEVPRLLAFGNPSLSPETVRKASDRTRGESFGPLPEAEQEVRALKELYGSQADVRIGSSATEEDFKKEAPHYRVLHLATHGMFADLEPMYSHLVLARRAGDAEDGLLEAREVADLDLNADLVVLSACESGRGESRGEGLIGLSWALLAAGCDKAVLADFKVDSAASRDLMIAFHRHLVRYRHSQLSGRIVTEDLRDAELAMLRSKGRSHPFYWAAFHVVGRGW